MLEQQLVNFHAANRPELVPATYRLTPAAVDAIAVIAARNRIFRKERIVDYAVRHLLRELTAESQR
jgi:hypothetical protein